MTLRTTIRPALVAIGALLLPSCEWDGHFTVLGYTTRPNYDTSIHTVYVPIFKNSTLWRGMEFEVTEAVIREIHQKTPYRVVSDCSVADTELTGNIVNLTKNRLNITQLNEVREAETVLTVEVVWRNRHTGEILSLPRSPAGPPPGLPPPTPEGQPVPPLPPLSQAKPTVITATSGFIPEIGSSMATARQDMANRLAVQIVSMMEKPW
jgi:hypothetical protein